MLQLEGSHLAPHKGIEPFIQAKVLKEVAGRSNIQLTEAMSAQGNMRL